MWSLTTRRDLLRLLAALGGVTALSGVAASPGPDRPTDEAAAPRTHGYRWRDRAAPGALARQSALADRVHASAVYRAPGPFNAVGSFWTGHDARLELRASDDGAAWTPWHTVTTNECHGLRRSQGDAWFGDLLTGWGWRYVQYRLTVPAGQPPTDVELVLIDSGDGPAVRGLLLAEPRGLAEPLDVSRPTIIARAGWGCDESLRFRGGEERWPPEYRTVQKAIVHHTATSNTYTDGAREVRAVYYYHAVQVEGTGWGDIGYNYLVDRWGNLYEGRYGGENVVAGHALRYNWGSTGIAVLGNNPTLVTAMTDGLARIVAWTGRSLDPQGRGYFIDRDFPTIFGHRDCLPTSCPGDNLWGHLPALRSAVQRIIEASAQPVPRLDRVAFIPERLAQGASLRVEFTLTNVGTAPLPTQGPPPGHTYDEGQTFLSIGHPEVSGAFRLAVDFEGRSPGSTDHPYRWGLPGSLAPGQSVQVVGYVRLPTLQKRSYWGGVVQELVKWWAVQDGSTLVTVLPGYCFPSTASASADQPAAPAAAAPAALSPRVLLPLTPGRVCE